MVGFEPFRWITVFSHQLLAEEIYMNYATLR